MCEKCKYIIKGEVLINGKIYNGCRKSRMDLPYDICDPKSEFCKNIKTK